MVSRKRGCPKCGFICKQKDCPECDRRVLCVYCRVPDNSLDDLRADHLSEED